MDELGLRSSWDIPGMQVNNIESLYSGILEEQRYLNEKQWEREDSAYQRMVADMKKAGLNPWTGISTGGLSSSSGVSGQSSALDRVISVLEYNLKNRNSGNKTFLDSINTGIKAALPFLAILGI